MTAPAPAAAIAVLPLANASGDPDKEYFSEGLSEHLRGALIGVRALRVVSRGEAAALQEKAPADLGKELGVGWMMDGSVTRLGGRLRLSVRLQSTGDGTIAWSAQIDRKYDEVLTVLREVTDRVLTTLAVTPRPEERTALDTVITGDVRAFEPYLRARHLSTWIRHSSQDLAVQLFGDAIAADATFALAYAGLALAHASLFTYWVSSEGNLRAADAGSARAVELAPQLAETHVARGVALSLNRQHDAAEREFQAALDLRPHLFAAHYHYARHCRTLGRFADSATWFESACLLRPEDYSAPALLASVYVSLGQPQQSTAAQRRALAAAERRLKLVPDDERALYLGAGCLATLGQPAKAREWAKRAVAMEPDDSAVLYNIACVYAQLGLKDSAIDCLGQAIKAGFGHWEWIEHDSDLDALRDHPRFKAVMQQKH
jgi:TolB-like protein/tetratricopeptide (TPR) repeat protein